MSEPVCKHCGKAREHHFRAQLNGVRYCFNDYTTSIAFTPNEEPADSPKDDIAAPEHYARLDPEPVRVIMAWGLPFTLGNVLKYIARAGYKAGNSTLKDLRKARQYLEFEIEELEKQSK